MGQLRLSTRGTLTDGGVSHRGRVVTIRNRISVRHGKDLLFDEQATSIDKISGKVFNATMEDGRQVQIVTEGCGCGGGR